MKYVSKKKKDKEKRKCLENGDQLLLNNRFPRLEQIKHSVSIFSFIQLIFVKQLICHKEVALEYLDG